jgi:myo-inositol-1(or 4)-monophosphatase
MRPGATPKDDLSFTRALAAQAGALLRAGAFSAHTAGHKRLEADLVTDFDRRSEALIVEGIRAAFPDDTVVAEEGGTHAGVSDRRWFVDPLDGTTNFAHGLPFFCVSIGLEVGGLVTVGVVEAPALGWSFFAGRGRGAHLGERKLSVSATPSLNASLLATGFPYDNATSEQNNFREFVHLYRATQGVRRVGAAALDLAMVAAGWMDGYWEMKLKPWDLAAGALLVLEAGGRVTSWSGAPFSCESGEAVATNGLIHDPLVAALATARSGSPREK